MVFFVISGFVLRLSLQHGPARLAASAGRFLLGRIFRIYPVVMFAVLVSALASGFEAARSGQGFQWPHAPQLIANLFLLDVSMNGSLWALQVELLMMPVILGLYFVERKTGPTVVLTAAVISTALAYSNRWAVWPPLSTNVFPFILGMVIPTLGRRLVQVLFKWSAIGFSAAAILVLLITHPCFGLYSRNSAVLEAYAATLFVSLVAYRSDLAHFRYLDGGLLRLLGRSSGSYYVLHMATLPLALAVATSLVPVSWSIHVPALVGCLVISCWLLAMAPLAICSFYLVEAPGIALGRHVIHAWRLGAWSAGRPENAILQRAA
jgi:peptidoglycan/LPS O-acetylase OafA/YrhL